MIQEEMAILNHSDTKLRSKYGGVKGSDLLLG
jgi:hypothetical protein